MSENNNSDDEKETCWNCDKELGDIYYSLNENNTGNKYCNRWCYEDGH